MDIRIISIFSGEAPEHIRAAWIGLILPAVFSGPRAIQTVGVLSHPKTWFGMLLARISGKTKQERGYIVDAQRAVEILAVHSPDAARWWRESAAHSLQPGQYFLFHSEVCQEDTYDC